MPGKLGLNCKYPLEKHMDCEYHILDTLAYVKIITRFKIEKPSYLVITQYKVVFLILL